MICAQYSEIYQIEYFVKAQYKLKSRFGATTRMVSPFYFAQDDAFNLTKTRKDIPVNLKCKWY